RHHVSYSTNAQGEQIVALADPGPLSVTVLRPSISASEGGAVEVPVRIGRGQKAELPIRLELVIPAHIKGVSADPIEVSTDQASASLTIRFATACGPFNMPLLIRAPA